MRSSAVAANEADSLDSGVVADTVDGVSSTVDNVQNARRQASTFAKFGQNQGSTRIAFTWLQNEGVAGGSR